MIILRDHYFVAWLNVTKNISYNINNNNEIQVNMTRNEYTTYLDEYKNDLKPVLKKIRFIVRELNAGINKASTSEKEKFAN